MKLESSIDSAVFSQQHHQSYNTDSLENKRGSTGKSEKSLSIEVSVADPDSPLNLMNENTVIGLVDENNTIEHHPNDVDSLKNNDFSTDVGPNSILNAHNDLKPVVVSTIDEKKLNPFRQTTSNNNVIPILEHANPMEPAIGFKMTDRKISQFNPWNIHTTECPLNKYRQNSTPHNKYLHVLKFEGDSSREHMERLKDASASNRHTVKLEGIEPSEESNNSNKANPQKRNTYKSTGAKEPGTTSTIINKRKKSNVKRQASPNGNQIRGGQSCLERNTPPGVDPITYHESAHCLRYSDLWYTVYHLRRPFVEHSVRLKLYEKYDYHDKNTHWDEITAGRQTNVGTFSRVVQDETPTFSFTYMPSSDQVLGPFQLDTDKSTLLVPQPVSDQLQDKYPQARAGPSEYLLLKSDQITQDGDECDKVGVGFSAFAKQPDRCSHVRGTCLTNQPLHLWQHDHEALANDKPGKYFLKNFACISLNPFIVNKSNSDEFLAIDYHNPYSATIEIEVKSDFNGIIRPGIGAQLPEVYVDATCDFNTKIIVTIANMGLASARFFPRLANCPGGLPEVWLTAQSPAFMIAPQHQHRFHLSLFGTLPIGRFHCSIDVLNDNHEIVATRRIRIQRYDRCFCLFHCLCACSASSKGLSCDQMSIEHYHAAGFMGSLPIPIVFEQKSVFEKNFNFWSYLLIAFLIGPLLLGFLKALSGVCCCTTISSAGMSLVGAGKAKTAASQEEGEGEDASKSAEDGQQQPNPVMQFCLNIFIFFYLIFVVIVKLLSVLCSIFCCFAICAIFNKRDSGDSESGKRKSSVSERSQLPSTDEERHVSFDDDADADDVDGEGEGEDGEGDGDEDEDEEDGEEEEDEDEEDDGEPDVLKITGGDSLDDDADIDLLEYFNKPDALEGDQVKKIMKKFKQYYKNNPPDKRESKSSDEEENDDVLSVLDTRQAVDGATAATGICRLRKSVRLGNRCAHQL
ncbi:uncharacterized protein LOC111062487 isoform X2 [Nilaparvata lugens]|uniref:uncharacterized protein LOC111062487 isoform X2 n=1 Tax=Nilaparvata lugens TaxID=108931 RepID=UPI00193CA4F5|nr:uncharacterized protein LOC111062487 isoform X2 [Nilaparvata lugens]